MTDPGPSVEPHWVVPPVQPQQPYPYGPPYQYGPPPAGYSTTSNTFTPTQAVSKQRKSTSHTFHLLMTIFTFGIWGAFVWFPLTLWHKFGPRKKVVQHYR